jgi:hypothetical protein
MGVLRASADLCAKGCGIDKNGAPGRTPLRGLCSFVHQSVKKSQQ